MHIALVFGLMAFFISDTFICKVCGSLSTKTGVAPTCAIGHIVVDHVTAGTITSSPFLRIFFFL